MTKLIHELYYMVDDWAAQQYEASEEAKALLARKSELKKEIALRLGADGQDLLDALSNLNVSLSDIHGQALFRAAMQLGTQIAQPRRSPWTPPRPSSNPRAAAGRRGTRVERRARRKGHI